MAEKSDKNYMFKFTWIVENFSMCPCEDACDRIESPEYIVENMDRSKWFVRLRPRCTGDMNGMICALERSKSDSTAIEAMEVDYKIEIEDSSKNIIFSKSGEGNFRKGTNAFYIFSNTDVLQYKPSVKDFLTVRCFMASEAYKNEKLVECAAHTNICFDRTSFKWTLCGLNSTTFSASKQFFYSSREIMFEINIQTSASEDDFKIVIRKLTEFKDFGALICRLTVLNRDGVEDISKTDTYCFKNGNQWELSNFLKKSLLKSSNLLHSTNSNLEYFYLLCDFFISRKRYISKIDYEFDAYKIDQHFLNIKEPINYNVISTKLYHADALTEDLSAMLINNLESDVILKIGKISFPAHKCILSTRSPVFRNMLQQDMSEKNSGVVEIQDIDLKTLKAFLDYLYTGDILNIDSDLALKLLLVGEKYLVQPLKKLCIDFIIPALTIINIYEVLIISDMINEETLKTAAIKFIKNHVAEVLPSLEWVEFVKTNSDLSIEIMREILIKSNMMDK